MTSVDTGDLITRLRTHVHALSGLITGISAGLYCGKISPDIDSAQPHIRESQQLAEEAENEIVELRKVIKEIEKAIGPENTQRAYQPTTRRPTPSAK